MLLISLVLGLRCANLSDPERADFFCDSLLAARNCRRILKLLHLNLGLALTLEGSGGVGVISP